MFLFRSVFAGWLSLRRIVRHERRESRRFATGVVQLYANDSSMGMSKFHNAL